MPAYRVKYSSTWRRAVRWVRDTRSSRTFSGHPGARAPETRDLFRVDGLVVLAAVFGWRAVRHLWRARAPDRDDSSIRLVWGIRALIIAVTSVAFALGIVYGSRTT